MKYSDVKNDLDSERGVYAEAGSGARLVFRQLNAIAGELESISYLLRQYLEKPKGRKRKPS